MVYSLRRLLLTLTLLVVAIPVLPVQHVSASKTTPIASYSIKASWDDQKKQIQGTERVTYLNSSRDSLSELWMHLYMNGFRDTSTTWMREALAGGGREAGQSIDLNKLGYIDITSFRVANGPALSASSEITETLMRVPLQQPLQPQQSIELDIAFTVQMPKTIARTGYEGEYVFAGQWYPKMAVYYVDPQGHGKWNNIQWHVNSEFFADFGTYDVSITLPEKLVIAATGIPQGERSSGDGTKTAIYHAEDVTDFAWTADPDFKTQTRKVTDTQTGIDVDLVLCYLPEVAGETGTYLKAAENALVYFSRWYGPYQHSRYVVVVPPAGSPSSGMEYPMLVTSDAVTPALGETLIANVTIHETGHQWVPMTLATNEMTEPWLDEGFTEFVTDRLMNQLYGREKSGLDLPYAYLGAFELERSNYLSSPEVTPIYGDSWSLPGYNVRAYMKPALVLATLEGYLGEDRFLKVLHTYWDRWKFKHPRTEDFIAVANEASGEDLGWFFDAFVYKTTILDYLLNEVTTQRQNDGTYRTNVTVARKTDIQLPVDLRLTFADGSVKNERWNAKQANQVLTYSSSSPALKVELDPDRKYPVELNKLDNGLTVQASIEPAVSVSSWWLTFLQSLFRVIGYAG